jgi:antitoxin YefM
MEITTYSNFRQNLKAFMDAVFTSRSPLYVTRANGEDVVVMSKADYEGLQETLYLLSSSTNAERLARGIAEFKQGKGVARDLIEE